MQSRWLTHFQDVKPNMQIYFISPGGSIPLAQSDCTLSLKLTPDPFCYLTFVLYSSVADRFDQRHLMYNLEILKYKTGI